MNGPADTAIASAHALGLYGCRCCGLVSQADDADRASPHPMRCPRCGFVLDARRPQSVALTLAFLAGATALYLPANLLPVMSTASLFGRQEHTLLGGIADLWHAGSFDLAAIVFIASIAVPILKIVALALLALSAQRRSVWRQLERARLHRMVEAVGHWSMLDIYVVVLLVGMLRFGALASVRPEPGLLAFGAVVVFTIIASSVFDPRLIWHPHDDD